MSGSSFPVSATSPIASEPLSTPSETTPGRGSHASPGRFVSWHRRCRWALLLLLLAIGMVWDLTRPPLQQLGARVALAGIHLYRHTAGPLISAGGVHCRFTPTCSAYAETCLRRFGLLEGSWLAIRRIVRCGPWTPAGTHDPPPSDDPPHEYRSSRSSSRHQPQAR